LSHKKSQKTLILLANHFPFGTGEAFLENEIDYLTAAFKRVIVITKDVTSTALRKPEAAFQYYRMNPKSSVREKLFALVLYGVGAFQVLRMIRAEIGNVQKAGKTFSVEMAGMMMHDLTKALITKHHINKVIKKYNVDGELIVYSYWLNAAALAATLVTAPSLTIKCISRAHGGDVYDARHRFGYIPFRKHLLENLHKVYAISEDGRRHLLHKTGVAKGNKVKVSRLGTPRPPAQVIQSSSAGQFIVASCSFLVPVKRIHLMIEGLSAMNHLNIRWIHIGDGPLRDELVEKAGRYLSGKRNVTYEFRGNMSNPELLRFYSENFIHAFLNTSLSEGVPVTIMEAQSFGIPVVAPHVGGVPEIVSDNNGRLLSATPDAAEVASVLGALLTLPQDAYQTLRRNAFANWKEKYSAEKNFPTFVDEILSL
jgi:glycosyltransferase involved in cell wall biosynthesis